MAKASGHLLTDWLLESPHNCLGTERRLAEGTPTGHSPMLDICPLSLLDTNYN